MVATSADLSAHVLAANTAEVTFLFDRLKKKAVNDKILTHTINAIQIAINNF